MLLEWIDDEATAYWAQQWQLPITSLVHTQYDGIKLITESTWLKHINQTRFPEYCLESPDRKIRPSPSNIIRCFQDEAYLEALALIVAWGGMTRTKGRIYTEPNTLIQTTLRQCALLTTKHHSVEPAWNLLIHKLHWGMVITSKVLHFLTRSLGYEHNPPVAIDNKVILEQVWPRFQNAVRAQYHIGAIHMPAAWSDESYSWQAYNRYMTAIRIWSDMKSWTTTQFEVTIFAEYYPT